jgi:serine/threonine protein kinase
VIFEEIDNSTKHKFAVKFPKVIDYLLDNEKIIAFNHEVEAARTIDHPHVVRIVYVNIDPKSPYLVMEYVEGGSLRKLLNGLVSSHQQLSLEIIKEWMGQLIDGIEAINEKVIHRDLRPENILVSSEGLKISDFGISKLVDAATRTHTFKGMGPIRHMAPEGWKNEKNTIQMDMYSLGIVFFELCSLTYPYEIKDTDGLDFQPYQDMHLFGAPKDIRSLRPDLPISIAQFITRMMAKRAIDRFQSWSDARTALEGAFEIVKEHPTTDSAHLLEKLLQVTTLSYEKSTKEEIERQKIANQENEKRALDEFMRDQLLEEIRSAVETFNKSCSLDKISISYRSPNIVIFDIQSGGRIELFFFPIKPPLQLQRGAIRFVACAKDSRGVGFNYLLGRNDADDLYGKWESCKITNSPLCGVDTNRNFGFEDPATFANEMQYSEGVMHVYCYKFGLGGTDPFVELIIDYMKSKAQ